jgi:ATP-dependent protease ClpP protease subunit
MHLTKHTRTNSNPEEDDGLLPGLSLLGMEKKPYKQFEQTFSASHIHFYLSESIGEPDQYIDLIHRIMTAGSADTIFIHLNTPGGQLDTGVQIINAIQNSQARVVTILEGVAYSLGTLIFLVGDEMIVNDHCMMMFHNFNSGLVGKGNEITLELDATNKWFATLSKQIYVPFLTEEELHRLSRGEDFWMQSAEIRRRLTHMLKIKNEPPKPRQPRKSKVVAEEAS